MNLFTRPLFYLDVAEEIEKLAKRAGANTAHRWDAGVQRTIKDLLAQPYLGRERKDLTPPTIRSWRVRGFPRWLIFYRVEDPKLVLLRVRYGAMDLPALEMES
jgi:plasmid stabilization system protein ParE